MSPCSTEPDEVTGSAGLCRANPNSSTGLELVPKGHTNQILHRSNGPVWRKCLLFVMIAILCPGGALSYCKCSTYHAEAPLELKKCSEGATPVYCFSRERSKVFVRFTGCSDCYPAKPPYVTPVPLPPLVPGLNPTPITSLNSTAKPLCPCTNYYPRLPSDCFDPEAATICTWNGKNYWTGKIVPKQPQGQPTPVCPDIPQTCWVTIDTNPQPESDNSLILD